MSKNNELNNEDTTITQPKKSVSENGDVINDDTVPLTRKSGSLDMTSSGMPKEENFISRKRKWVKSASTTSS